MTNTAIIVAAIAGLTAAASADVIDFNYYNHQGNDFSGLHMTVDVTDAGSAVDFTFRNLSSVDSVITAVYFENNGGSLLGGMVQGESGGVDFSDGATPNNPAQMPFWYGGAWGGTDYAAGAVDPSPTWGVNESGDEWLTIRFDYGAGATFDAVVNALTSDPTDFRIAMHIQSVGDAEFSIWGTSAPTPASLSLLGLAGLAAARRRR